MEIIKSTLHEHALPVSIVMSMGAVNGLVEAITLNKTAQYYNSTIRSNIFKKSVQNALCNLPLYSLSKFEGSDHSETYCKIAGLNLLYLAIILTTKFLSFREIYHIKNTLLQYNTRLDTQAKTQSNSTICEIADDSFKKCSNFIQYQRFFMTTAHCLLSCSLQVFIDNAQRLYHAKKYLQSATPCNH